MVKTTRSRRRMAGGAALACAVGLIGGCGAGATGSAGSEDPLGDVAVIAKPPASELTRADTLTACTETGTPPAAYYDENSELAGYLPDIGKAVAARMGLEPSFVDSVFDTIIVAANTGKCDVVIADQFITDDRRQQIDMLPYSQIGQQFLARADRAEAIGDVSADTTKLCGMKIGVLQGGAEVANANSMSSACQADGNPAIDVSTTTTTPAALQALQGGQIDLFFTDSPITGYYADKQPDTFATVGEPIDNVKAGISVPFKKPGVKAALVEVLDAMGKDGSLGAIFDKWGESAMTISQPGVQ